MRKLASVVVAACLLLTLPATADIKKKTKTCPKTLAGCHDDGCSTSRDVDGGLNEQKNIHLDDPRVQGPAQPMSLRDIKDLPDPENFAMGDARDELAAQGEG